MVQSGRSVHWFTQCAHTDHGLATVRISWPSIDHACRNDGACHRFRHRRQRRCRWVLPVCPSPHPSVQFPQHARRYRCRMTPECPRRRVSATPYVFSCPLSILTNDGCQGAPRQNGYIDREGELLPSIDTEAFRPRSLHHVVAAKIKKVLRKLLSRRGLPVSPEHGDGTRDRNRNHDHQHHGVRIIARPAPFGASAPRTIAISVACVAVVRQRCPPTRMIHVGRYGTAPDEG